MIFAGHRENGTAVVRVDGGEELPVRTDLWNHSPEFQWGYSGSGPAQLALAILARCCGDDIAGTPGLHQDFKADVIASMDAESWSIDSAFVKAWVVEWEARA